MQGWRKYIPRRTSALKVGPRDIKGVRIELKLISNITVADFEYYCSRLLLLFCPRNQTHTCRFYHSSSAADPFRETYISSEIAYRRVKTRDGRDTAVFSLQTM